MVTHLPADTFLSCNVQEAHRASRLVAFSRD